MALVQPPADALGSLLEESSRVDPTSRATTPLDSTGLDTEDSEPIPTLSSLLLSTAESLAARSSSLGHNKNASTVTKSKATPAPPSFALLSSPSTLLAQPASIDYLSSLLALPLPTLLSLPTSLATRSTSLDTDLSSLAFTRYSSFLLSHAATESITASFTTLSSNLSSLLDSTSELETAAGTFESRVQDVRKKRERMARVRERMEEVEELLEAPSVVDACVRAGYWSEAIDVAVRLAELHSRLSRGGSLRTSNGARDAEQTEGAGALLLLNRVRDEVAVALLSLRARVLDSLLQRSLKLPGAVRGVGILRRISEKGLDDGRDRKEMDEDALRIVFLAARWRCLRSELENVEAQMAASGIRLGGAAGTTPDDSTTETTVGVEENEERTRWTKRWIEVWREVVGETVGMYSEMFLVSSSLLSQASLTSPSPTALPATAPLTLFLTTSLTSLTATLSYAIPSLTSPSSLSSLLTQLSYCSHSFARHGLEFRELHQLRERVETRVGEIIVTEWEVAGRKWEKEWRDGWEGTNSSSARRMNGRPPVVDWLVTPEGLSSVFSTPAPPSLDPTSPPSATWHHQPPQPLSLLPPLARFLNAHASALNSLRLLPPLSLYEPLRVAQARELDRATQVLAAFTTAWLASTAGALSPRLNGDGEEDELAPEEKRLRELVEEERQLVSIAVAWFGRWVVPWCEGGLRLGVYSELTKGVTTSEEDRGLEAIRAAVRRTEGLVGKIEGKEEEQEQVAVAKGEEKSLANDEVILPPIAIDDLAPTPPIEDADAVEEMPVLATVVDNPEEVPPPDDEQPLKDEEPVVERSEELVEEQEGPALPTVAEDAPSQPPVSQQFAVVEPEESSPASPQFAESAALVEEPIPRSTETEALESTVPVLHVEEAPAVEESTAPAVLDDAPPAIPSVPDLEPSSLADISSDQSVPQALEFSEAGNAELIEPATTDAAGVEEDDDDDGEAAWGVGGDDLEGEDIDEKEESLV